MAYTNIDDPSAYFQTATYTGSNSLQAITNDGNSDLKPDWLWIKHRNGTEHHMLVDSTRGVSKYLLSSSTIAEQTVTSRVETLDTDGFTVNGASNPVNALGGTYVAWQWKANGGTTSSNTSGGVTSTVQVNQDAGFSIVTWTGDGANESIGHGLGTTPQVIITKDRDSANNWNVYHHKSNASAPYNYPIQLNLTNAASLATGSFGTSSSDINSNTFYLKYWYNYSGDMIAYCFAEKQGFSKFGKYKGNGNANGPFIYTGFKPAFVMMKNISVGASWHMVDNKRLNYNPTTKVIYANLSNAESTIDRVDLLSNGFKFRTTNTEVNGNGYNIIYMAFAENPFTTSTGVPCTAR